MSKIKARVKCNCCEKYFNIKMKEKNISDNFAIKIKYFTCPKCGVNYLVEIENNISRTLKDETRKISSVGFKSEEDKDKYQKLKSQIKENENELKEQYKEWLIKNNFLNV